jgi:hypothetical protein
VPYRQDLRVGRHTCRQCGHVNPAYGHLHSFDETGLRTLFAPRQLDFEYVCEHEWGQTNALAAALMDIAGNPWGAYGDPCLCCGARTEPPASRTPAQKVAGKAALALSKWHGRAPRANWIHALVH